MATFQDVTKALHRRAERTSKAEASDVVESIIGANRSVRNADPADFARLIEALDGDKAPKPQRPADDDDLDPLKIMNRWNSFRRAPRDDMGRPKLPGNGE